MAGIFTLFFAGSFQGHTASPIEVEVGIKNRLFSYFYPDGADSWLKVCKDNPFEGGKVILDSGAFSAWNSGKVINLNDYIEYAHRIISEFKSLGKTIYTVNLDVIPGKKGETKSLNKGFNQHIIDEAAKKGFENMLKMIENGIKPIHVFHQGESYKWLDKMVEYIDYIGISPANDLPTGQKRRWIDAVFNYLAKNNIKVRTHGFAVTSPSIMRDYPWTSCDSSTWRIAAGIGNIYYPSDGFKNADYTKQPLVISISKKLDLSPIEENKLKHLLEEDGYDWKEVRNSWKVRSKINARYFLGLEEYINKKRNQNHKYKIRKGLFD